MPCYSPLNGYTGPDGAFKWSAREGTGVELTVPCRQCIGCRITHSQDWKLRILHEARLHTDNIFLTLTYATAPLSLNYRDVQLFLKRVRKRLGPFRFFCVGEYGEQFSRPHYHLILFGLRFPDQRTISLTSPNPERQQSKICEKLWGLGHITIGAVNHKTASYVASYAFKRVNGDRAKTYYTVFDQDGVCHPIEPELIRMSNRPGIGHGWFQRFGSDAIRGDFCISNGRKVPLPKYYDRLLERTDPARLNELKEGREAQSLIHREERHYKRLAVRAEVAQARVNQQSKRKFET
ncbi:MAG: replication initiator protein [Microvirus sp.]|nr:MAG: replication initiator protein [Microvirus sp.]